MEFSYKKNDNDKLFASLERIDLGLNKLQNYIPLYNRFFALTDSNCNSINLNNDHYLHVIKNKETDNIVNGVIKHTGKKDKKMNQKIFFKYSPLLDPIKYLIGKYNVEDNTLLNLPTFKNDQELHEKIKDANNSAYVDSFFSYLSSKLLHHHKFVNGIDFFGSFLSIKENYPVNIYDDIDYIDEFDFFHKNKGVLFTVDEAYTNMVGNNTRGYKEKIKVSAEDGVIHLSDITELSLNMLNDNLLNGEINPSIIYETSCITSLGKDDDGQNDEKQNNEKQNDDNKKKTLSSSAHSSTCSSRSSCSSLSSNKEKGMDIDNNNNNNDESAGDDMSASVTNTDDDYSTIDGEEVLVKIKEFPVQTIALECCEDTLNALVEDEENPLTDEEWDSIILQILMSLIVYQNTFGLTHNDLHANNIMYMTTHEQFIYYKISDTYYKVPTFGRLFKIIDFGRAIYTFKGQLLCSDSFHPKGDAATQYNFPPYFNPKKPLVEPNFSFDLCRLGCSIYDCIVDDVSVEHTVTSPILKIIIGWCKDDKGRNILYKKNGEERYPDFKLYKMISRKVHHSVPSEVLKNAYFDKYKVAKKKISKSSCVVKVNSIPCYM
jgi:hypothetical protein